MLPKPVTASHPAPASKAPLLPLPTSWNHVARSSAETRAGKETPCTSGAGRFVSPATVEISDGNKATLNGSGTVITWANGIVWHR